MRWVYGVGFAGIAATFLADLFGITVNYPLITAWSVTFGALLVSYFTLSYGFQSNWRSNRIGKIMLAKSVLFSFTMWQIVATTWGGNEYPYREQIRFAIYASFALAYATMDIALWLEQRRDREHDREDSA
ncbi:putative phage holin [Mycobacterium adipatum]